MKNSNDRLLKIFYDLCDDIKKSKDFKDLYFRLGLACGFISGLFLVDIIDLGSFKKCMSILGQLKMSWKLNK